MKKDVENLQKKIEELTGSWKRALADYQNLEKRYEREKAEFTQFANSNLILKQLAVLDHLERVQSYLADDGLDLAIKEFKRVLTEEGLDEIEAAGKAFDPREMEVVEVVDGEEGIVKDIMSKGYRLKGRVIRPAKVRVGQVKKIKEKSE